MLVLNQRGVGTYWRAYYLAQELCAKGHQVTVMSTSPARRMGVTEVIDRGVHIVETPDLFSGSLRSGWDPWNVFNRIRWLKSKDYDLVHSFESRPTVIFPALYVSRKCNIPLVMDWADWFGRGGLVEERSNPFVRWLLYPVETYFEEHFRHRAIGTTVISNKLRERAINLGVRPGTILWLPNGSSFLHYQPQPVQAARKRSNIPPGVPCIGFVGAIFPSDARLMADAFDLVTQRLPDIHLVIAGYCPINIQKMVQCPDKVLQTGFIHQDILSDYLSSCDLFWLPMSDIIANQARLPLKLTDYMAFERPIIATNIGDAARLVEEYAIGLVCPPTPSGLSEATISLINRPILLDEYGNRARKTATEQFDWQMLSSKLEKHYSDVLNIYLSKNQ